jgi:preprotein translocase subunit SecD
MVQNVLQYGFAGILLLCLLAAWLSRPRRGVFIWAAFAAGAAAIGAHYFVFWATAVFGLMVLWALFCALPLIDLSWRLKAGFSIALFFGAILSIYPTYHDERHGKIVDDVPSDQKGELQEKALRGELGWNRFILSNVPFRLVRGLDLKGGLRLVYTVDVEEAIKDKRDRYYDELRAELTKVFGFHAGEADAPVTVAEMQKLAEKVRLEKPRDAATIVRVAFNDAADADKLDETFLKRYTGELTLLRSADRKLATFRVKPEVETSIRERAVSQAKDTVLRRVDGMGLKEAGVTVRDEDIIIEIPGDDEASFSKIREIISQTARLEFKMVDDDVDFFESIAKTAKEEDLPKGLRFEVENAPVGQGKTKPSRIAVLLRGEHEDMSDALKRMQEWVATLSVPDDHEIGFEKRLDYDEEKDVYEEIGWRSYYLFSKAEITGDLIATRRRSPTRAIAGSAAGTSRSSCRPQAGTASKRSPTRT